MGLLPRVQGSKRSPRFRRSRETAALSSSDNQYLLRLTAILAIDTPAIVADAGTSTRCKREPAQVQSGYVWGVAVTRMRLQVIQ